jgi:hypothetical protein
MGLARHVPPRRPALLLFTLVDVFFDQVRVNEHGPHVVSAAAAVFLDRAARGRRETSAM